jgi:ATP-binding cassette subfamily B protein
LLFNRSIKENLLVGKPDATEAEMRQACQRAQALEIIERHPEALRLPSESAGGTLGR